MLIYDLLVMKQNVSWDARNLITLYLPCKSDAKHVWKLERSSWIKEKVAHCHNARSGEIIIESIFVIFLLFLGECFIINEWFDKSSEAVLNLTHNDNLSFKV